MAPDCLMQRKTHGAYISYHLQSALDFVWPSSLACFIRHFTPQTLASSDISRRKHLFYPTFHAANTCIIRHFTPQTLASSNISRRKHLHQISSHAPAGSSSTTAKYQSVKYVSCQQSEAATTKLPQVRGACRCRCFRFQFQQILP